MIHTQPINIDAALDALQPFIGSGQMHVVCACLRGEEKEFFQQKMVELANTVSTMPKTYEQDGKGDAAIAYLHYFTRNCDWWITEKDMEAEQHQSFGFACLGGDWECAELGYISIVELLANGVELDFHFTPKTLGEIRSKR